jgi:glucose-6-phosphate 1-dehydrogenase
VGKRLPKSGTEISVHFKKAPPVLFNKESVTLDQNVLVVRIQPDEGISLRMQAKIPGTTLRIEPVKMDFHYGTSFGKPSPEAYERLLLDAMSGDATLFARRDEVEQAWAFIDPVEEEWKKQGENGIYFYEAGSWGPDQADELLSRDGRGWRRL